VVELNLFEEWSYSPRGKYLKIPWVDHSEDITSNSCYAYCLTAYLSYIDAMTGVNVSKCFGDYDKLFEEIKKEVDSDFSRYKEETNGFFKKKDIPLKVRSIFFRTPENKINEFLVRRVIYQYTIPILAIIDYEAFRHGRVSGNSNHSILILGEAGDGYIIYDPNNYSKIDIEHKIKIQRAWIPKLCEGILLMKKGMRAQVKRIGEVIPLDYFLNYEGDKNE
jgi:hypothetical protein